MISDWKFGIALEPFSPPEIKPSLLNEFCPASLFELGQAVIEVSLDVEDCLVLWIFGIICRRF